MKRRQAILLLNLPLRISFRTGEASMQFNSFYTVTFMLPAVLPIIYRRVLVSFHFLIWTALLLPLSASSVVSMPRYISLAFPFFLIAGTLLDSRKAAVLILIALYMLHMASYHFRILSPHLLGM